MRAGFWGWKWWRLCRWYGGQKGQSDSVSDVLLRCLLETRTTLLVQWCQWAGTQTSAENWPSPTEVACFSSCRGARTPTSGTPVTRLLLSFKKPAQSSLFSLAVVVVYHFLLTHTLYVFNNSWHWMACIVLNADVPLSNYSLTTSQDVRFICLKYRPVFGQ